ncbi:serine/threonine protein kinase [Cohnella pontilimi]|uniref:non-specific serine/threonine protein kinase n=1 Tax=Cohnella pontilimi TaxID=2564100 RepID=A0A4U0F2E2_9BACL|nr:serine/threonine protein kinase [Cohnella pontilimi]
MPPGTLVKGKWNGKKYRLERLLGIGANGQVYLASLGRSVCALKFSDEAAELQGEANVLASLDHTGKKRGRVPFLLDVDDFTLDGRDLPFYAMRYVPGTPVSAYLKRHGSQWMGVVGYRLLERLAELHEAGWVFSDIKTDNVLVHDYGAVELVDFGGATAAGRSVRQFTEIYDRGYWSAGSRTADPAYDWFAFAMLWLHALDGKRLLQLTRALLPQNRHPGELMKLVRSHPRLRTMEGWMEKAFRGGFQDTREALLEWRQAIRSSERTAKSSESHVPGWMAGLLAGSVVLCAAVAAVWFLQ